MSITVRDQKLNLDLLSDKGKEYLLLFYEFLLYKYEIHKDIEQELKNDIEHNPPQDNSDTRCS